MGCFFFLGVSFILRGVYFHRSRFIDRACVVKYCRIHHVSSIRSFEVRSSLLLVTDNSVRAARNLLKNAPPKEWSGGPLDLLWSVRFWSFTVRLVP